MTPTDALQPTTRAAMERLRNEIATNKALGPHGGSVDELLRDIEAVCDGLAQQQATIDTLRRALEERSKQWHDHFGDPWGGHSCGADHLSDWGECQSEPCLSDRQALAQAAEKLQEALND